MKYKYNEYRVEEQEQYKTSTIYAQDKSSLGKMWLYKSGIG